MNSYLKQKIRFFFSLVSLIIYYFIRYIQVDGGVVVAVVIGIDAVAAIGGAT